MALNITLGAAMLLIATVPEALAVLTSLRGYVERGYREYLFMFVTWFFLWIGNVLIGISYLTLDTQLYRVGIATSALLLFGIMLLVDSVSRDSVDARKLIVVTAAATALAILSLGPDVVTTSVSALGETGLAMTGGFAVAGSVVFLIAGAFWLYYMAMIHLRSPPVLKSYSSISLAGAILAGPGSILAFATGFVWIVPGTDYMLIGIGSFLTTYAFARQPKLAYVLPYKVFRLTAVDMESGLPMYTYTWDSEGLVDETLFTGALVGINQLLNESVSRGAIKHIVFEQGVLMVDHRARWDAAFVLVATRSSPMLQRALTIFAEGFCERFGDQLLEDRSSPTNFEDGDVLVDSSFPFVVAY